ncbi:MAG: cation:proton antiporter [Acidobacteria bacterium]|nr:cation:proton antiporter [Acidobacteriota bacterium]
MMRLIALAIIVGTTAVVSSAGADVARGGPGTALAIGFALIAASLTGELFERLRLPRISGYLMFGVACGPYASAILTPSMARELQVINGLAIALIAFIAGLEINFVRLRPQLRAMLTMGAVLVVLMWLSLTLLFFVTWPWLPVAPELTGPARFALAGLLATVTVSFSPTVSIAVITESRARGPLTELVLALVVLADLMLILLFTLSMETVRFALGSSQAGHGLLSGLAWEIFGSFAFGSVVGAFFALYLRYVGREITVMLLAVSVVLSQVGAALAFEPLLAALGAGLVVENIAPPEGDALRVAVERGALPVLVLFFAAAGANLHLGALASVGLLALVVAAVRLVLIRLSAQAGARLAGLHGEVPALAWMGLVSQAGVTLGLAILILAEFPEWGGRLYALIVAMIALHEMVGPILFRAALVRAGEVGRMDHPQPGEHLAVAAGPATS